MSSGSAQISGQDRIVVVMGPTGAGKSTFIEHATRQDGQTVGHSWKSTTAKIRTVRVIHPTDGRPIAFVDTPGFDDTFKSDIEILSMIADWLVQTYKGNVNLATILYLHRISDNRLSGSAMKNLNLFSSLCGGKAMPNVVIVTTMWSCVPEELGTKREEDLKKEVWNHMLNDGCRTERFKDTYDSAWDIIDGGAQKNRARVQLPREIVESHLGLNETEAGITLNKELEKLIKDQKDVTRRLKEQGKKQGNGLVVQELNLQTAEIQEKIRQTSDQLRQL
jgi:hypothetical protein